jgi:hypothetical protein
LCLLLYHQFFRTELQKRRKIHQEIDNVQRALGDGADRALAIAAVQQQADAAGSLRKLFDSISKRDYTGARAAEPEDDTGAAL